MDERYDPKKIEPAWQADWERTNLYLTREEPGRPKFYILEMFPYPSGAGLSVGHLHNYVPCDVIGRLQADGGIQRAAPDGMGCVRTARGKRGDPERIASNRNRPALRRQLQAPADNLRMRVRLDARDQLVVAGVLQVDAVVLPDALQARPGLPRAPERNGGATSAARSSPTNRSSTDAAGGIPTIRSARRISSSGTSRSPITRIDCSPIWTGSTGRNRSS